MTSDGGKLPRRLSAVMLADVKDYSARMGEDEVDAIAGIDDIGAVFERIVPQHGGSFEISSGDRFLAIFESAVEALEAAIDIQRHLAEARSRGTRALWIRIGIHLGEVVRTPFGLMGDSINITERIQSIAEPGGISVSDDLYRTVRNRVTQVTFRDTGPRTLKNIREPVRVYDVVLLPAAEGHAASPTGGPAPGSVPGREAPSARGMPRRSLLVAGVAAAAAGVGWAAWRRFSAPVGRIAAKPAQVATPGEPLVLGVMAVRSRGQVPDWMRDFTRDGLNTVLSKHPALLVYSRQKIDFLSEKRGLREMEVAEQLGIAKMISASLSEVDSRLALEMQIIDIKTGLIEGSHEITGSEKQLIEMQNEAAVEVMRSLHVPIDPAELTKLLAGRTNDRLEDYKLLTETMGGPGAGTSFTPDPTSGLPTPWLGHVGPRAAYASDVDQAAIRALLERYRAALESRDVGQVEVLHVELPESTRDALQRYFQNAQRLQVQFSKFDIVVEGDEALATLTRSDDFVDTRTGLPVHLEMRISNVLARQDGAWKIRGLKSPS